LSLVESDLKLHIEEQKKRLKSVRLCGACWEYETFPHKVGEEKIRVFFE
jgi:hypothetical protein